MPTTHYSDSPFLRRPIFPTMQNRTQSTNPWFSQVYPTKWSVGQANLDRPWPKERKRSFYPRLYIPDQCNYDRPTWYGESYKLKKKLCTLHKGTRKEEWMKKMWTGRSMRKTKWRKIAIRMEARRVKNWRRTYIVEKDRYEPGDITRQSTGSVSPVTNCGSLDVILPTTTEFCLKLNLYYLILAPLLEFMEICYCINHNVR